MWKPIDMTEDTEDISEGEALEAYERELDEAQNPDAPEYQEDAPASAGAGQPEA